MSPAGMTETEKVRVDIDVNIHPLPFYPLSGEMKGKNISCQPQNVAPPLCYSTGLANNPL